VGLSLEGSSIHEERIWMGMMWRYIDEEIVLNERMSK
jgi:hypothetical protein